MNTGIFLSKKRLKMTGQENKRTQDDVHEAVEQDSETTEDLLNTVCETLEIESEPESIQESISDIEALQVKLEKEKKRLSKE